MSNLKYVITQSENNGNGLNDLNIGSNDEDIGALKITITRLDKFSLKNCEWETTISLT